MTTTFFRSTIAALGVWSALSLGSGCVSPPRPLSPLEQLQLKLVQSPQDPRVLMQLAQSYFAGQDVLRARQYLVLAERTLAQHRPAPAQRSDEPRLRDEIFRLAVRIAVQSQQLSEAARRCAEFLEQKEELGVRELLATLLEALGDAAGAERQRELILRFHPEATEQYVAFGRFYERSARPDRLARARAQYERYLAVAGSGPEAATARAALVTIQLDTQRGQAP